MNDRFLALLVHDRAYPLEALNTVLKELSVESFRVWTCAEAQQLLPRARPDLIFTDTWFPDGSWTDVVDMAKGFDPPVNVVVVSATDDAKLYLSALERGAFDFVLPPFERQGLAFIVRAGAEDARHRRKVRALAALT